MYKIYRMEFDRSIKKNNVKFDFVKGNNINKKKINKKEDKKDKDDTPDVKEGFVNKNTFKFETNTFNFWVYLIITILVPIIGINGILLFHRYASFGEYDWNGISRNTKKDKRGTWYASNIYNDNGKYETINGKITYTDKDKENKMKFVDNESTLLKHYNNEGGNNINMCNKNSDNCKNWFATNKNKHINPIFDSTPYPNETHHIKYQYTNSEGSESDNPYNNENSWGIRKGFTHELSDTFDFYRGLIKIFVEFVIPGDKTYNGMNDELGRYLKKKRDIKEEKTEDNNNPIPDNGFGNDSLIKLFIYGIIFFAIGLLLSCLAPVISLLFGIRRFLGDGSGAGPLWSIFKASTYGEIIGLIGANLVSCLMPIYFLIYAIVFPIMDTGIPFSSILKSLSISVISFVIIMTTVFMATNTDVPTVPICIGSGLFLCCLISGFIKMHNSNN
jgi:hypothetical protein